MRFYGSVDVTRNPDGELEFHRKDTEHILAVPYDMPIIAANVNTANTLRMWNAEASDDLPAGRDYRKYLADVDDICLNLYPDDSTEEGRYLRIKQEYFFVAAGLQSILDDHMKIYGTLDNLSDKVVIQLNDTHPALAIPELMRMGANINVHGHASAIVRGVEKLSGSEFIFDFCEYAKKKHKKLFFLGGKEESNKLQKASNCSKF